MEAKVFRMQGHIMRRDKFISPLLAWMPFVSFSCLVTLAINNFQCVGEEL